MSVSLGRGIHTTATVLHVVKCSGYYWVRTVQSNESSGVSTICTICPYLSTDLSC